MLRELHLSGLGVIDDLDMEFDAGLNVLTGETGAGKTMIAVGLSLALGARASATLVRRGARAARAQARFDGPPPPSAADWADDDDDLVLARSVGLDGKSTARIAGQIATVGALAALGPDLVEVHGQHAAQRLLDPAAQAAFLDRFAGAEHLEAASSYRQRFAELTDCRARLVRSRELARDREREIDLLSYQRREIEAANVRPGEADELAAEERRLGNAERLIELAGSASAVLEADGGGVDAIREAASSMARAASMDEGARELAARSASLAEEAAELLREVRAYVERTEANPSQLAEVRARLHVLSELVRKYGDDERAILAFHGRTVERLAALRGAEDERARLESTLGALERSVDDAAERLTAGRRAATPALHTALTKELRDLGMESASVDLVLRDLAEPGPVGAEEVELQFAAAEDQPSLPLARSASGGELSRVMLACRSILADLDGVPTLVFDEVDAGVGGRAGVAVGKRLARIAADRQVLVVTHLPQIASFADRHIRVEKRAGTARATALDGPERVDELSRMLSGRPESESAATHAEELLALAVREKGEARSIPPKRAARRRAAARDRAALSNASVR